jgi:hypothetical protein
MIVRLKLQSRRLADWLTDGAEVSWKEFRYALLATPPGKFVYVSCRDRDYLWPVDSDAYRAK